MRRKNILAVLSLAATIILAAGCSNNGGKSGESKSENAAKAEIYTPAGAGFSIVLPAGLKEMKKETTSVDTPMGPKSMEMYQAEDNGVLYLASETKLTGIKLDLRAAIEGGLKGSAEGGTVIRKEKFSIAGNPALRARFKVQEDGKAVFVQYLLAYANETQFQLQVRTPDEKKLDSPEVRTFVNSFKFAGVKSAALTEKSAEKPSPKKK